uniref:RNA helicase n=1 Tax=Ascaris suum TaxID=6253 RepID=F1KWN7_ASCSU
MLYPPTITDETHVDDELSSGDEVDECVNVRKKTKKKSAFSDFCNEFTFDISPTRRDVDELQSVRPYLKKTLLSNLQEMIDKERTTLSLDKEPLTTEGSMEVVQELEHVSDSLRDKKTKRRRKRAEADSFFDETTSELVLASEPSVSFEYMNLSRPMLKAVGACGFTKPTPIQAACIPLALAGRDLCACAATGTGKTAAFMLPILERLLFKPKQKSVTRVLVLVPTRELAMQVFHVTRLLSQFSQVEICLCAGGLDIKAQEAALRLGPDIVIATPGRLIDHLHNAPNFSLHDIEVLVLDEADRMLDEAFADQMKELIRLCSANRQTLLFSATMTDQIEQLAAVSLKNPVRIFINENTETALNLRQEFIRIRENHEHERESIVVALVTRIFPDHTMLFVQTKRACQRLHIILGLLGIKVGQLHSGLSQTQRVETLSRFKNAELDLLISTDLAARGLDIEGVLTVINMQMPASLKQYIHRVGRTARAGRVGRSVSLFGAADRKLLKEIVATHKGAPLKQRRIDAGVIEAYSKRIAALEESIQRVEEEFKAERALRLAEEELQRGEDKLQGNAQKRHWMQPNGDKKNKKASKKLKKKSQQPEAKPSADEIRRQRADDYEVRNAKRDRKQRRMRAIVEDDHRSVKKRKSVMSMTSSLTSVTPKSVKRFRYGPTDAEFKAAKLKKMSSRRKKKH